MPHEANPGMPMRVGVVIEERFKRRGDGALVSPSGLDDEFWGRYVRAFGEVTIVARVEEIASGPCTGAVISNPRVRVHAIPSYVGPIGLLGSLWSVTTQLHGALDQLDSVIIRAPGALAVLSDLILRRLSKPFAVELVGDPRDVFSREVAGRAAPLLRTVFVRSTRSLIGRANAASYVTQRALQKRYPHGKGAITGTFSSICLPRELLAEETRTSAELLANGHCRIFTAGSLEVAYKGFDILILAVKRLMEMGCSVEVRVAGTGRYECELKRLVTDLGLYGVVTFLGRLPRTDVLAEMDSCDLYVQPSRTEGLPRAVIEAFARSAPVIASRVGGIPELLPDECLVAPGSVDELAMRIHSLLCDPNALVKMSRRNRSVAEDYVSDLLDARRTQFYSDFRAIAANVACATAIESGD